MDLLNLSFQELLTLQLIFNYTFIFQKCLDISLHKKLFQHLQKKNPTHDDFSLSCRHNLQNILGMK